MDQTGMFSIKRSWIISILLIVPAVALFGGWDIFFNDRQLQPYFRFDSLYLPLYLLFFELPHIFASFLGFFQKEYVTHYKRHLLLGLPLVLVIFLVLLEVHFYAAVAAYLVVTLFHVVRQQTGIAHFFGVPKNHWHWWWSWLLIVALASGYFIVVPGFIPDPETSVFLVVAQVALLLAALVTARLMLETKTKLGLLYCFTTALMAVVGYWMMMAGYEFLSVLVVRVIHDVTAFLFYITHEMNSNAKVVKNILYRFLPFMPWSLILFVPLIAVLVGLLLRSSVTEPLHLFGIAMTIGFAHYYLESIIWKRDNLHREFIKVE